MDMTCLRIVTVLCLGLLAATTNENNPAAHLHTSGAHVDPSFVDELSDFPLPLDFFNEYVNIGKPVILNSILKRGNGGFKPLSLWDDDYLREKFGGTLVDVEVKKNDQSNDELQPMSLRQFLDIYTHDDVHLAHSLTKSMTEDVSLPYSLRCGGFRKALALINILFSSDGTKSLLHVDEFDHIHCLLDGSNDVILYNKMYSDTIEQDGYDTELSDNSNDAESADMNSVPGLGKLPWFKVHMKKGDCLFIPARWHYQMNTHGHRNLAINWWMHHLHWFNQSDCTYNDKWKTYTTIDELSSLDEGLRVLLIDALGLEDGESLTEEEFLERWDYVSYNTDANSEVFNHIDINQDGYITWPELYTVGVLDLYHGYPKAFGNDIRSEFRAKLDILSTLHPRDESAPIKDEL